MSCGRSVKTLFFISYFLFITNCYRSLNKRCPLPYSLPNHPPDCYPVESCFSLPYASVYPPIFDALEWMEIQTGLPLYGFMNMCCQTLPWTRGWKLESSLKDSLSCFRTLFSSWILKKISLRIHQADLAIPTHQTFCLQCGVQRDLLIHIPPHKVKTVQTTTFTWVYFPQMTCQLLTMNPPPPPSVSTNSTNFDYGRTPSLSWSILSNIIAADLEKYESGSSSMSSSTSSITVFLPVITLDDEGILPVTHH